MTQEEIVFNVIERVQQHVDDSEVSLEHVKFMLNLERATYLRNEYNKANRSIDPDVTQTFCMPVKLVDASECECYESGCYVLRTVDKVPNWIELYNREGIIRVSSLSVLDIPFHYVSHKRALVSGNSRYNGDTVFAFLFNGYIYLKSHSRMVNVLNGEAIAVTGIFEDPEEAGKFSKCNSDESCYNPALDRYPIKAHTANYITEAVVQKLVHQLQIPEDDQNTAQGDPNPGDYRGYNYLNANRRRGRNRRDDD